MAGEIVQRRGGQLPLGGPGAGPAGLVAFRLTKNQRREMQDAAAEARLSLSEFIRRSGLWCCEPSVLRELIDQQRAERERKLSPGERQELDALRKRIKAVRRRPK